MYHTRQSATRLPGRLLPVTWLTLALLLAGCSMMGFNGGACDRASFDLSYRCLQQLPPAQLGLADAHGRQQYLIYAEKLHQDIALEGLSDAEAQVALRQRWRQLRDTPLQADQCARFAERILCY